MTKIKFTVEHFDELIQKGYSMDQVILLTWIKEGIDLDIPSRSIKVQTLYVSLTRKGLIDTNGLTELGNGLLDYMTTQDVSKLIQKRAPVKKKPVEIVVKTADFDAWWQTFPKNDTFDYKGMHFEGSRGMRVNEDRCRVVFNKILAEGEHTAQNMIDALVLDVTKRKEASIKEKSNKLKFLQNSLTYLLQKTYETYMDDVKAGVTFTESPSKRGGTDI